MKTLIKSIFVSLFFVSIFSSCQKEVIEPEKPYTCIVTSAGIESDVYLNNKKQQIDSTTQIDYYGTAVPVYYYSFDVITGDKLVSSLKNNPDISVLKNYKFTCLGVGFYPKNYLNNWKQLYDINFQDYDGDGDSEGYNFVCPHTDSDNDGILDGTFMGQDLDGDYYGDAGSIESFTYIF